MIFGFRPKAAQFQAFLNEGSLWSRRMLDYFLLVENMTFSLHSVVDRFQAQGFYTIMQAVPLYTLCDCLNANFERWDFPFWRLFHIPVRWERYYYVTQETPNFDTINVNVLRSNMRPRL